MGEMKSDMGGAAAGGTQGGLTEIYLEGLRFPMVKLYKRGKEDPELFGILNNNIRVPDKTLGDIADIALGIVAPDGREVANWQHGKKMEQGA